VVEALQLQGEHVRRRFDGVALVRRNFLVAPKQELAHQRVANNFRLAVHVCTYILGTLVSIVAGQRLLAREVLQASFNGAALLQQNP